jgi:NAD(P)H-hydrate epimerase
MLSREQARQIDQRAIDEFGMSSLVLMENAGRSVADTIQRLGFTGPVTICCGVGNNGGDGAVVARHLDLRGISTHVSVWGDRDRLTADARTNFAIIDRAGLKIQWFGRQHDAEHLSRSLDGSCLIVDALLGSGARGEPRTPLDVVIDQLNASHLPILAIDLPSGLDCDTGVAASHTIRATHTCTFVARKQGFATPKSVEYTGTVHVLDIGAPRVLIEQVLMA